MRILAIRGENLASLAARFEIDFTREPLAGAGLFAITGETGAGKSTILDALCVALYGSYPRVSVASREQAPDPSGTDITIQNPAALLRRGAGHGFAEVDFEAADGEAYRARWEVARARGRADGKLQPERRSLLRIDDEQPVAVGKKDVLERVEALTDLTFAQFCRTVLLAQGDFDAFLLANDGERAELLEKITGTEIYAELSRRAHAQTEQRRQALTRLEEQRDAVGLLDAPARENLLSERASCVQTSQDEQIALFDLQKRHAALEHIETARKRLADASRLVETAEAAWGNLREKRELLAEVAAVEPLRMRALALQQAQTALIEAEKALFVAEQARDDARQRLTVAEAEHARLRELDREAETLVTAFEPIWRQCELLDAEIDLVNEQCATVIASVQSAEEQARQAGERARALETQLAQELSRQDDLRKRLAASERQRIIADRADLIEMLLAERRTSLAERLETREDVARIVREVGQLDAEMTELSQALVEERAQRDRFAREIESRQEALVALSEPALRRQDAGLAALLERLRSAAHSLDRFAQAQNKLMAAREEGARAGLEANVAQERLEANQRDYEKSAAARKEITALIDLAEAAASKNAARLRANLVSGEPCPVCGSTQHPHLENENAATEFVAHIRHRRGAIDAELETASKAIEEAKGMKSAAMARGAEAERQAVAAELEAQASAEDYAHIRRSLDQDCTNAGLVCALPLDAKDAAAATFALMEEAQSARMALAAPLAKAEALRADIEHFRVLHDKVAKAAEATLAALNSKQESAGKLATRKTEAAAHLRYLEDKLHVSARSLAPYLAAAGLDLTAVDEDNAGAVDKLRALAASYRIVQADLAASETNLRKLEPAHAAAGIAVKVAAEAAGRARVALDAIKHALAAKRDARAAMLDGEATEVHRARHSEHRQHARAAFQDAAEALHAANNHSAATEALALAARERGGILRRTAAQAEADFTRDIIASGIAREHVEELLSLPVTLRDEMQRETEHAGRSLAEARANLEHRRKDLEELLTQQSDDVAEVLEGEIRQKQAILDELQRRIGAIDTRLAQDDAAREQASALATAIATAQSELAAWQAVDDAIGSASGDKFRRFVQGVTLDHLIQLANRQLADLAPRYALARTTSAELGLAVIDREMGFERRGTRSLSGGERFLVSLSLAIALSGLEGRQSFVDTLFIDEGFGSLDAETLDIAIDALECLQGQGRKVGVITHVAAMIERIAVQIRVEKHGHGRSRIAVAAPGLFSSIA